MRIANAHEFLPSANTDSDFAAIASRIREYGIRELEQVNSIDDLQDRQKKLVAIARAFTARGIPTRHGFTTWTRTQVRRVLSRAENR